MTANDLRGMAPVTSAGVLSGPADSGVRRALRYGFPRIVRPPQGPDEPSSIGAIGAVVARFVHTEEVTGSNPVSPTEEQSESDGRPRRSGRPLWSRW